MFRKLLLTTALAVMLPAAAMAGGTTSTSGSSAAAAATAKATANAAANLTADLSASGGQGGSVNNPGQVGAIGISIAAAGSCTGEAVGGALGLMSVTVAAEHIGVDKPCSDRDLLRIGADIAVKLNSPEVAKKVIAGFDKMYADSFGGEPAKTDGQPQQQGYVQQGPAAPVQTASVNPSCLGANTKTIWYANNCPAQ